MNSKQTEQYNAAIEEVKTIIESDRYKAFLNSLPDSIKIEYSDGTIEEIKP